MQERMKNHELVSALVDGELAESDFADTLQWLAHDAQARQVWDDYHLVGDVLRSGEAVLGSDTRCGVHAALAGILSARSTGHRDG